MAMSEIEILARAQAIGKWGFQVQVALLPGSQLVSAPPFVSDSLLTVETPAYMARVWTITLGAFKFQATPGGTLTNLFPAENQVYSDAFARCHVEWGIDGAQETAIIDYPCRGCTFSVLAANIRAKVFTELAFPALSQLPIYSGQMAPYPRAVQGGETWPQFTSSLLTLPSGIGQVIHYPIPRRAAAYRVRSGEVGGGPSQSVNITQEDQSRNFLWFDQGFATPGAQEPENKAGYYPLHPGAQFIGIANGEAAVHTLVLQFLLDMG
jgi:hypothetical protein